MSNECITFDLIMNYWVFHYVHIWMQVVHHEDFPGGSDHKEYACNAEDPGLIPGSGRFTWRKEWQPTLLFLGLPYWLRW